MIIVIVNLDNSKVFHKQVTKCVNLDMNLENFKCFKKFRSICYFLYSMKVQINKQLSH